MQSDITDFIGVFDNAFSKEYCDSLIRKFDVLSETNKALFPELILVKILCKWTTICTSQSKMMRHSHSIKK